MKTAGENAVGNSVVRASRDESVARRPPDIAEAVSDPYYSTSSSVTSWRPSLRSTATIAMNPPSSDEANRGKSNHVQCDDECSVARCVVTNVA